MNIIVKVGYRGNVKTLNEWLLASWYTNVFVNLTILHTSYVIPGTVSNQAIIMFAVL